MMVGTRTQLDPALRKCLAELPAGDPDATPPDTLEVWVAFCEGSHEVPYGVPTNVDFGPWRGPVMRSEDVMLHIKNLRTGNELSVRAGDFPAIKGPSSVVPGANLSCTNTEFRV